MRLSRKQRIEIFRPHVMLQRLDDQEERFVLTAMQTVRWQAQHLQQAYESNQSVASMILAPMLVRQLALTLASSMIDTYNLGSVSLQNELIAAENLRQSKAAFNQQLLPIAGSPFYPEVGVDWYQEYSLRLVGVQQADALNKAKLAVEQGILHGLSQQEVMDELKKTFTDFSQHRLENIARTETAKIYEQSRWQQMDSDESIVGYEYAAIMDTRTSDICRSRDGKRIPKDKIEGWLPPSHFMCRSQILPIFRWEDGIEYSDTSEVTPALPGFGTTSMEIPPYRDNQSKQVIRNARMQ